MNENKKEISKKNFFANHLLVGRYGSPAVECKQRSPRAAYDFRDYHRDHETNPLVCLKCEAAYQRRLAAVMAKKLAANS